MSGTQWFQVIASLALQATLLLSVAWALQCRTTCPKSQTQIWNACFISLLLLVASACVFPRREWFHPWSYATAEQIFQVARAERATGCALIAVWAMGVAAIAARWIRQFWQVRLFIANCPELPKETQARLKATALRIASPEFPASRQDGIEFREGPSALGPFCYQFHKPLIFLPSALHSGDEAELELVLRHEVMHLQTQHPLQLFTQQLAQTAFWFHPMVWKCGRQSSLSREFVCDDAASGDARTTARYLKTLLHQAELAAPTPNGALMLRRNQSDLLRRARRLSREWNRVKTPRTWAPAAVCFMGLLISQLWLPTDPLASEAAAFSPWPSWTATVGHAFGLTLPDFEPYDSDLQWDELLERVTSGS
ncbi:MAG: M56 family metallopeptidase [Planctomycetales bacterium]|nr:M56 family metallopeptidase [Planctomycetales bacterium]